MNDYVSDLFLLLITWRPRYVSEILITAFSSVQFVLFVAVHFRHCILYYKHSLNILRILMFHKHTIKCVIRYACFLQQYLCCLMPLKEFVWLFDCNVSYETFRIISSIIYSYSRLRPCWRVQLGPSNLHVLIYLQLTAVFRHEEYHYSDVHILCSYNKVQKIRPKYVLNQVNYQVLYYIILGKY